MIIDSFRRDDFHVELLEMVKTLGLADTIQGLVCVCDKLAMDWDDWYEQDCHEPKLVALYTSYGSKLEKLASDANDNGL